MFRFIVQIGNHEISKTNEEKINKIFSDFFNCTCKVFNRVAIGRGRSMESNKQYRFNINQRYASIKLWFDASVSHKAEFVTHEIRKILNLSNYNIKQITGFPMNGDNGVQVIVF